MSARHAYQKASDSKSLWNYTLSPGFTKEDVFVLRKAIIRYGCGNWQKIKPHFPEKNNGQLNLQCQKLFGQQSLATWSGVHVDPLVIKQINDAKVVKLRKNGCIINTGRNLTKEKRDQQKAENIEKYGLPREFYNRVKVPVLKVERKIVSQNDRVKALGRLYHVYNTLSKTIKLVEEGKYTEEMQAEEMRRLTGEDTTKNTKNGKKTNNKSNGNGANGENDDSGDTDMTNENSNKPESSKSKTKTKAKAKSKPRKSAKKSTKKTTKSKSRRKPASSRKKGKTTVSKTGSNNNDALPLKPSAAPSKIQENDNSNENESKTSEMKDENMNGNNGSEKKRVNRKRKTFMDDEDSNGDNNEDDDDDDSAYMPPPSKKAKISKNTKNTKIKKNESDVAVTTMKLKDGDDNDNDNENDVAMK